MDDNREFKINLHAGDPDDDPNSTVAFVKQKNKPSKTKTSVMFIVLSFMVFGGILAFFYYNLNSKIRVINTLGSAGIESLSNDINDKFSDFSQQVSSQQKTTEVLLANLEAQLKKLNASVSVIENGKLDKKDLQKTVNGIKKDIAPLQESINKFENQLLHINEEIQDISDNLKKVQTGVLNNKKEISTLDAIHIDRVYFDQELKKEREFNQQNMAHASEALFSEIATLHQLIKDLENKLDRTNMPSSTKSQTNKSPSDNISIPKPGEIIEQEIK